MSSIFVQETTELLDEWIGASDTQSATSKSLAIGSDQKANEAAEVNGAELSTMKPPLISFFENDANVRITAPEFLIEGEGEGFQLTLEFADVGQLSTTIQYSLASDSEATADDVSIGSGSASISVVRSPSGVYEFVLPFQRTSIPGRDEEARFFELIDDDIAEGTEILRISISVSGRQFENGSSVFVLEIPIYDNEPITLNGTEGEFFGTPVRDEIFGSDTVDEINAGSGDDTLYGDPLRALDPDSFEAQIYRAYQSVFDRAPDKAGFEAFLTEVRLGNLTQQEVIAEFVASAEFVDTYGELSNREFVEQLYRNVLDREGDAGGIDAFTSALDGGRSRASVVVEFANSGEFVRATTEGSAAFGSSIALDPAEGQVYRIYEAVFGREPDAGGFTNFVNSIQGSVLDLNAIAQEFVASAEFQDTYGELSNREFVELLYTNVLPGNEDQTGRDAFVTALDNGSLSRSDMVAEFSESAEFRARTDADARAFRDMVFTDNADILDGGSGNDVMFGGRGADTFIFDTKDGGQDTILDYSAGVDQIEISGGDADFDIAQELLDAASQVGNNVVFDFGNDQTLTLNNVRLDELSASDFDFGSSSPAQKKPEIGPAVSEINVALAELSAPELAVEALPEMGSDLWEMFG